jgi:HPt (histidine-containing phosphotransfer) domain-containing protein
MMDDDSDEDSLTNKLHELALQFASRLPGKMLEMQQMMQKCISEGPNQQNLHTMHRLLHSLAGSAGIFGFVELGLRAQALEITIKALVDLPHWPESELEQIAQSLDALSVWSVENSNAGEQLK